MFGTLFSKRGVRPCLSFQAKKLPKTRVYATNVVKWCLSLQVKKLPKVVHATDAYKGLYVQVKEFQSTCPLVGGLKRSKLCHRHWEELLNSSNGDMAGFPVRDVENCLQLKVLRLYFESRCHLVCVPVECCCDAHFSSLQTLVTIYRCSGYQLAPSSFKSLARGKMFVISSLIGSVPSQTFSSRNSLACGYRGLIVFAYMILSLTHITGLAESRPSDHVSRSRSHRR